MPDITSKFVPANLHIDPKTVQNLNVTPVLQHGGPTPDAATALQNAVTALQAANSALTDRVADLEKQMVAVRLVLQGIDPAFAAVKQQIADSKQQVADFQTEYSAHSHTLPFGYESFTFLEQTGDNNKPNFLMPYVWEGSDQSMSDFQRQQNAQIVGRYTSAPQQKP